MKYFSMFSGIGGFELGINNAWRDTIQGKKTDIQHSERDKSVPQGQEEQNHKRDNGSIRDSKNSNGALFQNGQEPSNPSTINMGEIEVFTQSGQPIRPTSDGVLREGHGIRNDSETLLGQRGIPKSNRWEQPICVGYSEIDKYAVQIYQKHFGQGVCLENQKSEMSRIGDTEGQSCEQFDASPEGFNGNNKNKGHKNYGDCTRIKWEDVEDFELLVGGFPCQAFSIAGKRGGFKDTRGTLFFEIARCLKEKQPRLFVLENVKGLLSHDKGATFVTIIATLDELGYDLQWQVLNSKNFSVPQNRERVFIVGHLRGSSRPEVFPIGEKSSKSCIEVGTIKAINGNDILKRCYSTEGISPVLNTCGGGNTEGKFFVNEARFREYSVSKTAQSVKVGGDIGSCFDGIKIRRLTPTECERLQGFPDGWTEGISDTQRYKCLGNAVTVNVIEAIMDRLLTEKESK